MADEGRLEGRKAAVTGAGGFIGTAICRRLVGEGARVLGLDLSSPSPARVEATGAGFAAVDVCDRERSGGSPGHRVGGKGPGPARVEGQVPYEEGMRRTDEWLRAEGLV